MVNVCLHHKGLGQEVKQHHCELHNRYSVAYQWISGLGAGFVGQGKKASNENS